MTGSLLGVACFETVPPLRSACTPSAPCYDGPPGTDGEGRCRAGSSLCGEDGALTCTDQILPSPEVCSSPLAEDEDCDGATNDHCARWNHTYGAEGPDATLALLSSNGVVYAAGRFVNNLRRDNAEPGLLGGESPGQAFLLTLSADGAHLDQQAVTGEGEETIHALAKAGEALYVVGDYSRELEVGAERRNTTGNRSEPRAFVARAPLIVAGDGTERLDPLAFTADFGEGNETGTASFVAAAATTRGVVAAGWYQGAASIAGESLQAEDRDVLLVALTPDGELQ